MDKKLLERFIQKYHLGGTVEAALWHVKEKKLSTRFSTDNKSIIGELSLDGVELENGDYGIFHTDKLKSLLNILGDTLLITVQKSGGRATALAIKDSSDTTSVMFVLADPANIPKAPSIKELPDFNLSFELDAPFVSKFIGAHKALGDSNELTIVAREDGIDAVLGHNTKINTNRVTIPTTYLKSEVADPIQFRGDYLREILAANKEGLPGIMQVSSAGLARISFAIPNFDVVYYLPALDNG